MSSLRNFPNSGLKNMRSFVFKTIRSISTSITYFCCSCASLTSAVTRCHFKRQPRPASLLPLVVRRKYGEVISLTQRALNTFDLYVLFYLKIISYCSIYVNLVYEKRFMIPVEVKAPNEISPVGAFIKR